MSSPRCVVCGEPIAVRDERYERTIGFSKRRQSRGGPNNFRLRVGLREYAHVKCVEDASLAIKRGEANLLDYLVDVDIARLQAERSLEAENG